MSVHISAKKGEIAPTVLMPGDPLRAKYIADNFLQDVKQVSSVRNALYFTGTYKGKAVSVGASGMGDVECIISVGACGAYTTDLKLFDIINVERAYSESTYALHAFGFTGEHIYHEGDAYETINEKAGERGMTIIKGAIHSSDIFYRDKKGTPEIAVKNDCPAVEMESFALFANARYLKKSAATLLTVSDIIPTHEQMTSVQREKALKDMIELALESVIGM